MNSITIYGSIGEPRFRDVNTKTGTRQIASFGICQTEGKDAQGNTIFAWYNAEYWMNQDSKLKQYLVKGARILAVGELKTEKWKDKNTGEEKSAVKIAIRNLELAGDKREQTPATTQPPTTDDSDDGDLPDFLRD